MSKQKWDSSQVYNPIPTQVDLKPVIHSYADLTWSGNSIFYHIYICMYIFIIKFNKSINYLLLITSKAVILLALRVFNPPITGWIPSTKDLWHIVLVVSVLLVFVLISFWTNIQVVGKIRSCPNAHVISPKLKYLLKNTPFENLDVYGKRCSL